MALATPDQYAAPSDPADAVLRIPHPAVLIGGSLAFLSVVTGLAVRYQVRVAGGWVGGALLIGGAAVVAALSAVTLLTVRRAHTMPATLAGLLVLDAVPVIMQFGALAPADARARVLFLVIPTVIAASALAPTAHRIHLVGAMALATVMVGAPMGGRGLIDRIIETCIAVGVLLAADLLVRRLSTATASRIFALRALALTDGLTGVLNRRGLAAGFHQLVRRARKDTPIGLLIVDIDHFKWLNDEYGHAAGDEVLRRVCQVLTTAAGPGNLVARIGGEELAALVIGRAEPVALAFTEALASVRPRVTASIGLVDVRHDDCLPRDALWHILNAADRALYEAKNTGRNRICRAELDTAVPADRPVTPAPARAAVPGPAAVPSTGLVTALPPARLPGWALVVFGVIGLLSDLERDPAPLSDPTDWLYLAVSVACVIAGIALVTVTPRIDPYRLIGGVMGADLVIALGVLNLDDTPSRLTALLPLLLTGLVVAQYASRIALSAHHAVVALICLLAFGPSVTLLTIMAVALHAAVLIGSAELIGYLRRRHDTAAADLHTWSVTDPLTGLANRRGLELAFTRMSRAYDVTILALDVDDFKTVNDRHGHAVGDDTLVRLAATLRAVSGPGTVVGRTGGDEFVLLAPATPVGVLTSRVSGAAALLPVPLSVSVGSTVAAPYHRLSLWQLVAAADAGLTRAKRNRRAAAGHTAPSPEDTLRHGQGPIEPARWVHPAGTEDEQTDRIPVVPQVVPPIRPSASTAGPPPVAAEGTVGRFGTDG